MPSEIRIYFEGDPALRPGFVLFFRELRAAANDCRIKINPIGCKAQAAKRFRLALNEYPDAFNLLLVDAEAPVTTTSRWEHLETRQANRIDRPEGASEDQAHLMVQIMESWFLADKDALQNYYGQDFAPGKLPDRPDIESVPKAEVLRALKEATKKKKKGYHKTAHAPSILGMIDPAKVRKASPSCRKLFTAIESIIEAN